MAQTVIAEDKFYTVSAANGKDVTGRLTEAAAQELKEYGLTARLDGDADRVAARYPLPGLQIRRNSMVFLDATGENAPALEE